MAKLKWRMKLVAERHPGVVSETELACIERDEAVSLADLGLRLEAKRLTAALQAEMVPAQMAALGECSRACEACGRGLATKGHYGATFRSLFGNVPMQVRRLFVCPCRGEDGANSVAALDFGGAAVAPELACVTARCAALALFGKVAAVLSELLPLDGVQHAGTVRNRTLRVGVEAVQAHAVEAPNQPAAQVSGLVVVGLDGGYVRDRHRGEGWRFEVVAVQGDPWRRRPEPFRVRPRWPGARVRGVPVSARCGRSARGHARDRLVRRGCRAVAAAARGACPVPPSYSTGGTPQCVSSTRCRRPAVSARAQPRRVSPAWWSGAWSGRSGACGTGTGQYAGDVIHMIGLSSPN